MKLSAGPYSSNLEISNCRRWKCHLAHTDAAEVSQIRDERWSTVLVNTIKLYIKLTSNLHQIYIKFTSNLLQIYITLIYFGP